MLINYLKRKDYISDKTVKTIHKILLPLGLLCLSASLIISRYLAGSPGVDFIAGFLMGLSIVLNLAGLIIISRQRKR